MIYSPRKLDFSFSETQLESTKMTKCITADQQRENDLAVGENQ